MALSIGKFTLPSPVFVAPMAGVTDLPFREIIASLCPCCTEGEMVSANPDLLHSSKSEMRICFGNDSSPHIVQLLGANPAWLREAVHFVEARGAEVIDINMGCPAKKVCKTDCGSALLRDEFQAEAVLRSVCETASVPVILKMRTGWDASSVNAVRIARAAESCGISLITVHGRTRQQGYSGSAEYDTIRLVKDAVNIPVIANGDIDSPQKALQVIGRTGADGVMIGRGCLGNPWLPGRVHAVLSGLPDPGEPSGEERCRVILRHMERHIAFYGERSGEKSFRKHLFWYLQRIPGGESFSRQLFKQENIKEVQKNLLEFFKKALQ